jgi:hypothetical protein
LIGRVFDCDSLVGLSGKISGVSNKGPQRTLHSPTDPCGVRGGSTESPWTPWRLHVISGDSVRSLRSLAGVSSEFVEPTRSLPGVCGVHQESARSLWSQLGLFEQFIKFVQWSPNGVRYPYSWSSPDGVHATPWSLQGVLSALNVAPRGTWTQDLIKKSHDLNNKHHYPLHQEGFCICKALFQHILPLMLNKVTDPNHHQLIWYSNQTCLFFWCESNHDKNQRLILLFIATLSHLHRLLQPFN